MDDLVVAGATAVVIGRDVLNAEAVLGSADPQFVAVVSSAAAGEVADTVAAGLRGTRRSVGRVLIPDGEAAKTLATVEEVVVALNDLGMTRGGLIVAVGGGSTTDLAGFVAATYLRGVSTHYVTTTLLGAVDAAIGGKTGVNVGGKNLVGVFRHPDRVVIDVAVLERLPDHLKREGCAEALKAGFVADPSLVALLERDGIDADLELVVRRAVAVKAGIVSRDFAETGERAVLNYGHTIGHAVEVVAGLSHGAAVAVGMVAAARASEIEAGFDHRSRHDAAIRRLGLPVACPPVDPRRIEAMMAFDKKRDEGGLRMVLLEDFGRPKVTHVGAATVRAALDAVGIRRHP
ncbi:MAG TPA: 3-dehydroquinate synthase family protein [Acidimicrobiia bacterium]|nr:3-dehydroquinate synthase family protein [Acidimicrobiia bacterium]